MIKNKEAYIWQKLIVEKLARNVRKRTKVLGTGNRGALWLQGCQRNCKGCMSPMTRSLDGGKLIDANQLFDEFAELSDIEGITISGGEPFLQGKALSFFLKRIRTETELGVIIYTGYTVEELRSLKDEYIDSILDGLVDLIIDGEYVEALNDGKALKGSSEACTYYGQIYDARGTISDQK